MIVNVNVDELRSLALLAVDSANKMKETDSVISKIVSKHDWKCPERVKIDETLEGIKSNSIVLNNTFESFSSKLVEMANMFTDFINDEIRDDAAYDDDIACAITNLMGGRAVTTINCGNNIGTLSSELEATSMNASNISSLYSSTHGINIMDFSLFNEE